MPSVWTCFLCVPCRTTIAKGGTWAVVMHCPCCNRPMERTEHRPEKSA